MGSFAARLLCLPYRPRRHITGKVQRRLDENSFLRKNHQQFSPLTPRECGILRLQSLGQSSHEIADVLFIPVRTVKRHRRDIKLKLAPESAFELAQYARAFDLI